MAIAYDERPPALADGVQLIGEYEGSGYKEPPSLVRRADGQVIQLPPLLYAVVEEVDGARDYPQIAREVSNVIQRGLDADQVRFLVEEKLRPLGIVTEPDGTSPVVDKADPFLALRLRMGVIPERVSNVLGALFQPLFQPLLVVAVLAAFVAADVWLFAYHGVAQAVRQSIERPAMFLVLFAAVVASAAFHEIGHAAACRYGGGRPGKMGCGLYLAWPAFYTDVTDAYRLGRRARLRTDLGGVYFNVIVVLATTAAYLTTRFEPLLLLVLIQHFEIVHQLLPVIRLDGYYIVADLTGVPDLFARIGPILRSAQPWHRTEDEVRVLKRWVRIAVTSWVVVVVPLLAFELLMLLVHLPRILGTAGDSGARLWHAASVAFAGGHTVGVATAALQLVALVIPIVGILLVLTKTARKGTSWMWTSTAGRPVARGAAIIAMAAGATALLSAWLPRGNYHRIEPGERGTLGEGIGAMRSLPSGAGPLYSKRAADERAARAGNPTPSTDPAMIPSTSTSTTVAGTSGTGETSTTTAGAGTSPSASSTTVPGATSTSPAPTSSTPSSSTTTEPPSTTTSRTVP